MAVMRTMIHDIIVKRARPRCHFNQRPRSPEAPAARLKAPAMVITQSLFTGDTSIQPRMSNPVEQIRSTSVERRMFFLASGGEADDIIGWWIAGSGGGDDGLRTASNKIERRLSDVIKLLPKHSTKPVKK